LAGDAHNAVLRVNVDQLRRVFGEFDLGIRREAGDDQDIARRGAARCRTIHRDDTGSALGAQGVGREALAVVDVPDVDLFVLTNVRRIEKIFVDRA
jgi:hypothetical protein